MKFIENCVVTFKISVLAYLIVQANSVIAGSINVCNGSNSAKGITTTEANNASGCIARQGVSIYEWNYEGLSSTSHASIGVGINDSGSAQGQIYINAPKGTTINSTIDIKNHQIKELAAGTLDNDAVNLGQLKDSTTAILSQSTTYTDSAKTDAITQSKSYTDTAKADAIEQSNSYTDSAKADAIAQSNIHSDQKINKLNDQVIHYDTNADGTLNKNSVTLAGENGATLANVANGKVDTTSRDAINGSQLNVTNQALAEYLGGGAEYNTVTQGFYAPTFKIGDSNYNNVGDAVSALDHRIDRLARQVDKLEGQLEQGLAMSAAMAGLFQPYGVGKFNVSVAGGGYGSQGAIAVGSGFRFNKAVAMKAGVSTVPGKGKASYNMGVNFEW